MEQRADERLIAEVQQLIHTIAFGRAAAPPDVWLQTELSMGQLCALLVLQHGGPARIGALAQALHMSPNATTAVVDRLETAGFVERAPDPADRRAVLVQASTAGAATVEQLMSANIQQLEGRLRQMSLDDLVALQRGGTALLRVMEQEQADADATARARRRAG